MKWTSHFNVQSSIDLEFAVARTAQKWVIKDYSPTSLWTIEEVPEDTGFDEELVTLILGSRMPILFVEGDHGSLDMAIYRRCYPEWTVIPRGSCSEVIYSVVTMRKNADLTRITCSGIVDGDGHNDEDRKYLAERGIKVLPVSEIENVIALPDVSRAIAEAEGYEGPELEEVLNQLSEAILKTINSPKKIEVVVVRYCKRRIDRMLKKVDLSEAGTIDELEKNYRSWTEALNIKSIVDQATEQINKAIEERNLPKLLSYYDNKEIIALSASSYLKFWPNPPTRGIAILIYEDKYHTTSACNIRYHDGYAIGMRWQPNRSRERACRDVEACRFCFRRS